MRTFEIILLIVVTLLPFVKRPVIRSIQPRYLVGILGILTILHFTIEGWRWQMAPAYLLLVILSWRLLTLNTDTVRLTFLRFIGYLGIVAVAAVGWIIPMVLPVFALPEPTGTHAVGTTSIHHVTQLDESITLDPSDKREFMYKVWYPGQGPTNDYKRDIYVDRGSRSGFATKYGLPANALNYLDRVKTHAYQELPISQGRFPVLIFSHGYGSKATGYYALLSEIASQGYIVINMNHTYESLGVTLPNGKVKSFDYDFQRQISEGSMTTVEPLIKAFKDGLDYEERHPIVREAVKTYFEGTIEDRWADDVILTLDLLEGWNDFGLLKNKINLDQIGIFGHSVGGGTAGKVAMRDERIKAAANLDGIQWGDMIDSTYQIPYLYLSADWPAEHEDINSHVYINKSTDLFYECKLLNSGHPNFMDIPLMIPVNSLSGCGTIDPYLGIEITNSLVTAFFDTHLKGLPNNNPKQVRNKYDLLEMTIHKGKLAQSLEKP